MNVLIPNAFVTTFALFLCAAAAYAQPVVGAAPAGPANEVAARIINANHPGCDGVTGAMRLPDGSIRAYCNDEPYLVFTIFDPTTGETLEVAMNCAKAKKLLNISC